VPRVTIADIAKRAKVSTSAVSYALNDRPGVGAATRQQILAIAEEMGWRPNSAARSLQAARAHAVGLVFQRSEDTSVESSGFMLRFLDGVQSQLSERDMVLVLRTVHDLDAEMAVHERWFAESRVDGIIVVNPIVDDPRVPVLERMGLPAVVVGDTRSYSSLPAVWTDDADAARLAVEHLVGLGHKRIARVGGMIDLLHTRIRRDAFAAAMSAAGLADDLSVDNATERDADRVTRELLRARRPPTAILYEGDTMAMSALSTLRRMRIRVPADMSVIAWDDSPLCRLAYPPLSALRRDAFTYGQLVSEHLLALLAGRKVSDRRGTVAEMVERESTARAPVRSRTKVSPSPPRR
jgi:DNA-binding LacI/PurR family transcriptional regulator